MSDPEIEVGAAARSGSTACPPGRTRSTPTAAVRRSAGPRHAGRVVRSTGAPRSRRPSRTPAGAVADRVPRAGRPDLAGGAEPRGRPGPYPAAAGRRGRREAGPGRRPDRAPSATPVATSEQPALATAPTWKNFSADGRREAVIIAGQPTFVDVAFLALGTARKGVCRISVTFPRGGGYGTGFRVGQRHLLTNTTFSSTPSRAREGADRGGVVRLRGRRQQADAHHRPGPCDLGTGVRRGERLGPGGRAKPSPTHTRSCRSSEARDPQVDDRVYIVQHPGRPAEEDRLPAQPGSRCRAGAAAVLDGHRGRSSGSPVFDDNWDLVGLHHFAAPRRPESRRRCVTRAD